MVILGKIPGNLSGTSHDTRNHAAHAQETANLHQCRCRQEEVRIHVSTPHAESRKIATFDLLRLPNMVIKFLQEKHNVIKCNLEIGRFVLLSPSSPDKLFKALLEFGATQELFHL